MLNEENEKKIAEISSRLDKNFQETLEHVFAISLLTDDKTLVPDVTKILGDFEGRMKRCFITHCSQYQQAVHKDEVNKVLSDLNIKGSG